MITPDLSWDLSATINYNDTNNNSGNTKITGRFNPSTTTAENLEILLKAFINFFTTNSYTDSKLTVQKSLNELLGEE